MKRFQISFKCILLCSFLCIKLCLKTFHSLKLVVFPCGTLILVKASYILKDFTAKNKAEMSNFISILRLNSKNTTFKSKEIFWHHTAQGEQTKCTASNLYSSQKKTEQITKFSVFLDFPIMLFGSCLYVNCSHLLKIYTNHITSICRSVKKINIPWFSMIFNSC